MYSNKDSIELFNQMVAMGLYYSSARPVAVDPAIIIEDICGKIPINANDTLLDVGCGTGVVTIPLSRRCRSIHAIDAAEKVLEAARRRCREEGVANVTYYLGSTMQLPFKEDSFDHVIMYSVVHYLENQEQIKECVIELVRVLKPGGCILIADVPDQQAREAFERRPKTIQEQKILDEFKANRGEFDQLFKEHVEKRPESDLVLDCGRIVREAAYLGCEGSVCLQDIRQPFSLTRRDIVLQKKK